MKPRRTSLLFEAAAKGSVPAPAAATSTSPPTLDAGPSPSAALRERLTQTRARMARAQARRPPQIDIEWDPEEPPTRRYDYDGADFFVSWRRGQAYPTGPQASRARLGSSEMPIAPDTQSLQPQPSAELPDTRPRGRARSAEMALGTIDPQPTERAARPRARSAEVAVGTIDPQPTERPTRARARSGEVFVGTRFGEAAYVEPQASDALDPAEFPGGQPRRRVRDASATPLTIEPVAEHIAPISTPATRPPLATLLLREVSALAEHMQALYARVDHSERALRNRVAFCSGALLLLAAFIALFSHNRSEPRAEPQPTAAFAPIAPPRTASVSVSSDPPGAQIFVDGQASGKVTPASITGLTPGKHRLGLQLAGYSEATEALRLPEDALLSIKLAALSAPRSAPQALENRPPTRAELRTQARALARERRAAARAARVLSRYRARMGLGADPSAPELSDPGAAKPR